MAAVAGDAENINKQARKMRTNWTKNKQAANGLLSLVLGPSGGCPRRQALRTGPPPFTYGSYSPHTRCRGIACHVREVVVFGVLEHLECSWQPHIQGRGAKKRTQRAG